MSDDLVERLRLALKVGLHPEMNLISEAADEIERLRERVAGRAARLREGGAVSEKERVPTVEELITWSMGQADVRWARVVFSPWGHACATALAERLRAALARVAELEKGALREPPVSATTLVELEAEIERLRAEVAELRQDRDRMSMMDQWVLLCSIVEKAQLWHDGREYRLDFDGASVLAKGETLRAAIDAAREGEK